MTIINCTPRIHFPPHTFTGTHTQAHIHTETHTQFGTKINGGIYMPGLDKEYEKYVDQSSTVFAHLMSNAVQSTAK